MKEVAKLNATGNDFRLFEVMPLPAAYTKGADAMGRSKSEYQRETISFDVASFDQVVRQVEALAKVGAPVSSEDLYSPVKKHAGKSRDLPLVDYALRSALEIHLNVQLNKGAFQTLRSPFCHSKRWFLLP